jgi:precorrin isomerase
LFLLVKKKEVNTQKEKNTAQIVSLLTQNYLPEVNERKTKTRSREQKKKWIQNGEKGKQHLDFFIENNERKSN